MQINQSSPILWPILVIKYLKVHSSNVINLHTSMYAITCIKTTVCILTGGKTGLPCCPLIGGLS